MEILDETRRLPRAERVRRALARMLDELGLGGRSVTVVIVDDAAMRRRNARDRGVDAATDVLSYPTFEPDGAVMPEVDHLGDVFVALGVAERQAARRGLTTAEEVAVLVAHGLTHLRGFDHPDPERADEPAWRPFREAERRALELMRA